MKGRTYPYPPAPAPLVLQATPAEGGGIRKYMKPPPQLQFPILPPPPPPPARLQFPRYMPKGHDQGGVPPEPIVLQAVPAQDRKGIKRYMIPKSLMPPPPPPRPPLPPLPPPKPTRPPLPPHKPTIPPPPPPRPAHKPPRPPHTPTLHTGAGARPHQNQGDLKEAMKPPKKRTSRHVFSVAELGSPHFYVQAHARRSFSDPKNWIFGGQLHRRPCPHPHCKNMVTIGLPYCQVHSAQHFGVHIVQTKYGKGLVATRPIPRGTPICPYGGERLSPLDTQFRYDVSRDGRLRKHKGKIIERDAPYAYQALNRLVKPNNANTSKYMHVDSALQRWIGSMANHSDNPNAVVIDKPNKNPPVPSPGDDRRGARFPWLTALRDIKTGEEVVWNYGESYKVNESKASHRTLPGNMPTQLGDFMQQKKRNYLKNFKR